MREHCLVAGVGAVDGLRAGDAGVVGNVESVVGHEEIIVAVVVDNLGSLRALPARGAAAPDALAVAVGGESGSRRSPGIAEFLQRLTRLSIELHGSKARVPRAVDEPVLTFGRDDVGGVDGVEVEVGFPVVLAAALPSVLALVGRRADDEALVLPLIGGGVAGLHHADEGAFGPGAVVVGRSVGLARLDVVVDHDAIIHAIEAALHLAHARSPVAQLRVVDGVEALLGTNLVELRLHPRGSRRHGASEVFPVDEVLRATGVEVAAGSMSVAIGGVGLIHVVVAVVGQYHRRIVDVGEVPLRALRPVGDVAIVVGIGGSLPLVEVGLSSFLLGGEGHVAGVGHSGAALCVGTHVVSGGGLEAAERDAHLAGCRGLLRVVDRGIGSGAVAHAALADAAARGLGCDDGRVGGDGRHDGCRDVGVVGLFGFVAVAATSSKCHGDATAHA